MGSAEFPYLENSFSKDAFLNSADAVKAYLLAPNGLNISSAHLLDLFASSGSVEQQDEAITQFLSQLLSVDVVILYYVGHGGFLRDRDYFLTLKSTRPGREHVTAFRMRDLAATFLNFSATKKIVVILDCCFSGSAVEEWQAGDITELIKAKTFNSFPASGTALLVAASKDDPAITPTGAQYTMFAEALIYVLTTGVAAKGELLSLRDVGEKAAELIMEKYGLDGVRPEVHSPRQINQDVASIPVFPNHSHATILRAPVKFGEVSPADWTTASTGALWARIAKLFDDRG